MRVISSFLLPLFFIGCGAIEERYSLDENSEEPVKEANVGIAFHTATGWQNVVNFFVESNAPDQVVEASLAAADTWNDAIGYPLLRFSGVVEHDRGDSLYNSLDDSQTVIYYEQDWLKTTGKRTTTLATTIWENAAESDEIVKGDIILNAELYVYQDSTETAKDPSRTDYIVDSETVLLHEFGHLIGLDHIAEEDDEDSIMHTKTFIGAYIYSREVSASDQANIASLYDRLN